MEPRSTWGPESTSHFTKCPATQGTWVMGIAGRLHAGPLPPILSLSVPPAASVHNYNPDGPWETRVLALLGARWAQTAEEPAYRAAGALGLRWGLSLQTKKTNSNAHSWQNPGSGGQKLSQPVLQAPESSAPWGGGRSHTAGEVGVGPPSRRPGTAA